MQTVFALPVRKRQQLPASPGATAHHDELIAPTKRLRQALGILKRAVHKVAARQARRSQSPRVIEESGQPPRA